MGEYYIAHYGIKGMKWGVRRWQNPDGTFNDAGMARYGVRNSMSNYKGVHASVGSVYKGRDHKYKIASNGGQSKQALGQKVKTVSQNMKKAGKTVSKGAEKAGEAIQASIKDPIGTIVNTKRKFATYVLGKNEVDTVIKSNVELSRIQTSKKFENFAYYATYKKHDTNEYAGLFGKNLKTRAMTAAKASKDPKEIENARNMKVYKMMLKNRQNLRVPSDSHAGAITASLLKKNGQFKSNLATSLRDARTQMKRPGQQALLSKAQRLLNKNPDSLSEKDKITIYKALNLTLTYHDANNIKVQNEFYGAMKKKGYGALVDVNDKSYSSYHAKRPMIVFDTSGTKVSSTRELGGKEINKLYHKYNRERITKEVVNQAVTALPNMIRTKGNDYSTWHESRKDYDHQYDNIVPKKKKKTTGGPS